MRSLELLQFWDDDKPDKQMRGTFVDALYCFSVKAFNMSTYSSASFS